MRRWFRRSSDQYRPLLTPHQFVWMLCYPDGKAWTVLTPSVVPDDLSDGTTFWDTRMRVLVEVVCDKKVHVWMLDDDGRYDEAQRSEMLLIRQPT